MRTDIQRHSIGFNLVVLLLLGSQASTAKTQKPIISTIEISAPPELVFEAIRKQRDSVVLHRKLMSYDGKVATIKENLENVPIYGKVQCIWQENEIPYERIDYTMLKSDKFATGFGGWILTPSADRKSTKLELRSFLDSGLCIPLAGEITKIGAAKDGKIRLQHIKTMAEDLVQHKSESGHGLINKDKK